MASMRKSEMIYKVERTPEQTTYVWHGRKHFVPPAPVLGNTFHEPETPQENVNTTCPFCTGAIDAESKQGAPIVAKPPTYSQSASAQIKVFHDTPVNDTGQPNGQPPRGFDITSYEDHHNTSVIDRVKFFENYPKKSPRGNTTMTYSEEVLSGPHTSPGDAKPDKIRLDDANSCGTGNTSYHTGYSSPGATSSGCESGDNSFEDLGLPSYDEVTKSQKPAQTTTKVSEDSLCTKHKHLKEWFREDLYQESLENFRKEVESLVSKKDSGVYSPDDSLDFDKTPTSNPFEFPYSVANGSVFPSPRVDDASGHTDYFSDTEDPVNGSTENDRSHEEIFEEIMADLELCGADEMEATFATFDRTYNSLSQPQPRKYERPALPKKPARRATKTPAGSNLQTNNQVALNGKAKDRWSPETVMENILEKAGNESDDFAELIFGEAGSLKRGVQRALVSCQMKSEVELGGKAFTETKSRKLDVRAKEYNNTQETGGPQITEYTEVPSEKNEERMEIDSGFALSDGGTSFDCDLEKELDLLDFYRTFMKQEEDSFDQMLKSPPKSKSPTPERNEPLEHVEYEESPPNLETEADLQNYINIALASIHSAKVKIEEEIEKSEKERDAQNENTDVNNKELSPKQNVTSTSSTPSSTLKCKRIAGDNPVKYYEVNVDNTAQVELLLNPLNTEKSCTDPKSHESGVEEEAPPPVSDIIRKFEGFTPKVRLRKITSEKPEVSPKPNVQSDQDTTPTTDANVTHQRTEVFVEGANPPSLMRKVGSHNRINVSPDKENIYFGDMEMPVQAPEIINKATVPNDVHFKQATSHPTPSQLDGLSRVINEELSPIAERENVKVNANKKFKRRKLRKPKLAVPESSGGIIKDVALFKNTIKPHDPREGELLSEEISTEEVVITLRYPKGMFLPKNENIYRDLIHHRVTRYKAPDPKHTSGSVEGVNKLMIEENLTDDKKEESRNTYKDQKPLQGANVNASLNTKKFLSQNSRSEDKSFANASIRNDYRPGAVNVNANLNTRKFSLPPALVVNRSQDNSFASEQSMDSVFAECEEYLNTTKRSGKSERYERSV